MEAVDAEPEKMYAYLRLLREGDDAEELFETHLGRCSVPASIGLMGPRPVHSAVAEAVEP
ncbi:hypothetical protein [Pyrodictium abyssi]|uniref:Uncharacterized protein n=1 Tax=Pyrodictium abyssi TaxID=54256 RepID=A0ABM8IVV4_9CREN|nr:hypothetical protein PABY_12490 [Pyrodictium abyssi]